MSLKERETLKETLMKLFNPKDKKLKKEIYSRWIYKLGALLMKSMFGSLKEFILSTFYAAREFLTIAFYAHAFPRIKKKYGIRKKRRPE